MMDELTPALERLTAAVEAMAEAVDVAQAKMEQHCTGPQTILAGVAIIGMLPPLQHIQAQADRLDLVRKRLELTLSRLKP